MRKYIIKLTQYTSDMRQLEYVEVFAESMASAQFTYNAFYHQAYSYYNLEIVDAIDGHCIQGTSYTLGAPK